VASLQNVKKILQDVRHGKISPEEALDLLRAFPYEKIDDILFDHHRQLRKGFPEVIYGKGKSSGQLKTVLKRLLEQDEPILLTRVDQVKAMEVLEKFPRLSYDSMARAIYYMPRGGNQSPGTGQREEVVVVTAGTSDLPVAKEASITLKLMGICHKEVVDVGVAGIHRLFSHLDLLTDARVIICIAGMEGALPSIVAGLVKCPVIAVPTSTGYGSNMGGLVPLMAMLNSCAPGVGVVNIDNGYGAAALAASILWAQLN